MIGEELVNRFQERYISTLDEIKILIENIRENPEKSGLFVRIARLLSHIRGTAMVLKLDKLSATLSLLEEVAVKMVFTTDESILTRGNNILYTSILYLKTSSNSMPKQFLPLRTDFVKKLSDIINELGGPSKRLTQQKIDELLTAKKESANPL
jgi:hypothetical protein